MLIRPNNITVILAGVWTSPWVLMMDYKDEISVTTGITLGTIENMITVFGILIPAIFFVFGINYIWLGLIRSPELDWFKDGKDAVRRLFIYALAIIVCVLVYELGLIAIAST